CLLADVGERQRLAQPVRQRREPDEAGARAPLEQALLLRHAARLQEWNELLAERPSSDLDVFLVVDVEPEIARGFPRDHRREEGKQIVLVNVIPEPFHEGPSPSVPLALLGRFRLVKHMRWPVDHAVIDPCSSRNGRWPIRPANSSSWVMNTTP